MPVPEVTRASYTCACCGKDHGELPRFFLFRVPEQYARDDSGLSFDSKFTCRHADGKYFISCELELPIHGHEDLMMGFICWAEVAESTYLSYLAYRATVDEATAFEELVDGTLANPVPCVAGTLGSRIKFRILPDDPTPYIRWVEPNTDLAARVAQGATPEYWHAVVDRW
jgi:hypothetical protein